MVSHFFPLSLVDRTLLFPDLARPHDRVIFFVHDHIKVVKEELHHHLYLHSHWSVVVVVRVLSLMQKLHCSRQPKRLFQQAGSPHFHWLPQTAVEAVAVVVAATSLGRQWQCRRRYYC